MHPLTNEIQKVRAAARLRRIANMPTIYCEMPINWKDIEAVAGKDIWP